MFYPIDLTKAKHGKTTKLFTIPKKYFNKFVGTIKLSSVLYNTSCFCFLLLLLFDDNFTKKYNQTNLEIFFVIYLKTLCA